MAKVELHPERGNKLEHEDKTSAEVKKSRREHEASVMRERSGGESKGGRYGKGRGREREKVREGRREGGTEGEIGRAHV